MESKNLEKVRIDRWLWAVRVFKTRGQAADACKGGKVEIGGENVKPSRPVRVGETIEVTKDEILREYKVVKLLLKRVGAKVVPQYMEDLTPPERLEVRRETLAQVVLKREAGSGRPTKRDRRDMERLFGDG
ncbi:RNA-binding S4 domain-containing protein [Pelagicoccus sp. SDUM812002]|uniref:RNA-binding S4 domain-containing protein n=1 Tax=Pelagicoccus sp. SDUM812002 TaxID=3041266 RepID=UPI00280C5E96|nr:RNA-binding S4 domain-containing protein [Pelagicoccus sp. SDUM812002]MDQ8186264.1 RNA-binding S4 domain-containing protein [Pelagicoccus sp. SDUM812002]